MRKFMLLATAVALFYVGPLWSTQFPITPAAGEWLILIQSYTGENSEQLADELAATLRRDYKLNAYVFNRSEEQQRKERERVEKLRREREELIRSKTLPKDTKWEKIRTIRIEDSYAVMIGGWKDMESARKELDVVRKLKPLPEKFMHKGEVVAPSADKSGRERIYGGYNPFLTAFVAHNPLMPTAVDPEKGKLQNLKEFNADESYSLLKCRKPFTLVVQRYQGAVKLASASDPKAGFFEKIANTAKPGQVLNASANQAHNLADVLKQLRDERKQPIVKTDIYVLHTEGASYVCVGGYDRPDDQELQYYQRKLANLQLGAVEQLLPKPMPMPVPKP
jgi:hypothetical protein